MDALLAVAVEEIGLEGREGKLAIVAFDVLVSLAQPALGPVNSL
jgi:hypothetical protein